MTVTTLLPLVPKALLNQHIPNQSRQSCFNSPPSVGPRTNPSPSDICGHTYWIYVISSSSVSFSLFRHPLWIYWIILIHWFIDWNRTILHFNCCCILLYTILLLLQLLYKKIYVIFFSHLYLSITKKVANYLPPSLPPSLPEAGRSDFGITYQTTFKRCLLAYSYLLLLLLLLLGTNFTFWF